MLIKRPPVILTGFFLAPKCFSYKGDGWSLGFSLKGTLIDFYWFPHIDIYLHRPRWTLIWDIYLRYGHLWTLIWTFIAPISPPKKWASRQLLASPPLIFCPPPRRALDLAEVWKSRRECGQKKGIHKGDIIIQQLLVDVFQGISIYIKYVYIYIYMY